MNGFVETPSFSVGEKFNEIPCSLFMRKPVVSAEWTIEKSVNFDFSIAGEERERLCQVYLEFGFFDDFSAFLQNAFLLKETVSFYLSCNAVNAARKLLEDHLEKYPVAKYSSSLEAEKMLRAIAPPEVKWVPRQEAAPPDLNFEAALEDFTGWVVISDNEVVARAKSLKELQRFIAGLDKAFLIKKIPEQW